MTPDGNGDGVVMAKPLTTTTVAVASVINELPALVDICAVP